MSFLRAFGAHLPPRIVTNEEIAARIGKTPEWIRDVSGIEQRRWATPDVSVADLAAEAGRDCLARAEADPAQLGLVIVASGTAEQRFPGPAAATAHRLGIPGIPAIDVPMASAGSLFGLAMAAKLVDQFRNILVIGAERMSAVIDVEPLDPNTAILFGDGAGACLVTAEEGPWRVVDSALHSDGAFSEALRLPLSGPLAMDGFGVIMNASRKIPAAINSLLARNGRVPAAIDHFVMHQANLNLILRVAKALAVPAERFFSNIARYGNTSAASMLIAAAEADLTGSSMCMATFGAGFHWGALLAVREAR